MITREKRKIELLQDNSDGHLRYTVSLQKDNGCVSRPENHWFPMVTGMNVCVQSLRLCLKWPLPCQRRCRLSSFTLKYGNVNNST